MQMDFVNESTVWHGRLPCTCTTSRKRTMLRSPADQRAQPALRALTADEFVLRLVLDVRTQVHEVIDELITKRQRRPVTRVALLDQLDVAIPRAMAELRSAD